MKTSNKLFITAILIVLISIVAVNFELKAKYLNMQKLGPKQYEKEHRFDEFEQVKVQNFHSIDFKAADALSVNIEYGKTQAVWIKKWTREMIEVSQNGTNLVVDLSKKGKSENYFTPAFNVIIITPHLNKVNTAPHKSSTEENNRKRSGWDIRTVISEFQQDSLQLNVGGMTKIKLNKNQLKYVNATVGNEMADGDFVVNSDNNIETLKLKAFGRSKIELLDGEITNIQHQLSDEAIVTFRGKVLPRLK